MATTRIKLLILTCAALALAGCIPKADLKSPTPAPRVTGPFDLYFPDAENVFDGPETVSKIQSKKARQEEQVAVVPHKGEIPIGLLIPKTGSSSALGKDFEDAAILALYDAKLAFPGGYRLTLIPKDTAGSPSVATQQAKALVDGKIPIIVGPLFSQSTQAVARTASPDLMISLSNNSAVRGENRFVFGFTPEAEMARVLSYALKQNNHRISAILPNNAYGHKLEKVIRTTIPGFGASLDAVEYYVPTANGIEVASKRLANRLRPINTDVICFGDSKANAGKIVQQLRNEGVDVTHSMKLGTSLWHNDTAPTPRNLTRAVYTASDEKNYGRFRKRFKSSYGREPNRLAILVYDAITMLAEAASLGNIPSRQDLMATEIIQGPASGAYRFEPDGSVTRGLALYQLTPSSFKVIENAPKNF